MDMVKFEIEIDKELMEEYQSICEDNNLSDSHQLRKLIKKFLDSDDFYRDHTADFGKHQNYSPYTKKYKI